MSEPGKIALRSKSCFLSPLLYDCMTCQGAGLCGSYIVYLASKPQGFFFHDVLLRLLFIIVDGDSLRFVYGLSGSSLPGPGPFFVSANH